MPRLVKVEISLFMRSKPNSAAASDLLMKDMDPSENLLPTRLHTGPGDARYTSGATFAGLLCYFLSSFGFSNIASCFRE